MVRFFHSFVISLGFLTTTLNSWSEVKETHQIISEWVETESLISEESAKWETEKAALLDISAALEAEIVELKQKLQFSEDEASGVELQRTELMDRKEKAEKTITTLNQRIIEIKTELQSLFTFLPSPLANRLLPFREKLNSEDKDLVLSLVQRVETTVSLLQAIHLFHRTVCLERQEFTLDEEESREFLVLYFGLGCAYFVNESETIAGYGIPSDTGWKWTRKDDLAVEISTGVDMVKNRTMPRFLTLPVLAPKGINQ